MKHIPGVEPLHLLPNRLEIADFNPAEVEQLLGEGIQGQELSKQSFNWVGAFLVEQVGLHETEVADWFKSEAQNLDGEKPIDVWTDFDGFERVFAYAKAYKEKVEDALVDEPLRLAGDYGHMLNKSHGIANSALDIIRKSFDSARVPIGFGNGAWTSSRTIHNPRDPRAPFVRWKGNGFMEDYRIIRSVDGERSLYYIARCIDESETPMILQTGVVALSNEPDHASSSDSDINNRPPSAGEVAGFVIPLAVEIKKRSLQEFSHA